MSKTNSETLAKPSEPWNDKGRFLIVQHIIKHADCSNLFDNLADALYSKQWSRKISKYLLGVYGDRPSVSPVGSPLKRKRQAEPKQDETKVAEENCVST
uniref:Uncharacterized protein n=1 Tax=Melanopsichium pennsylvanicum 4 TaxID=1398559 RepID=A0A077R5E8_9BASI|nr:hypothetical protein BN887_06153 [Melanopsichium pennsylvanicum 4]